jgi:hypothetical protein
VLLVAEVQGSPAGFGAAAVIVLAMLIVTIDWSTWGRLGPDLESYGLSPCTGVGGPVGGGEPPLAEWLTDVHDQTAHHSRSPVTFGDLMDTGV